MYTYGWGVPVDHAKAVAWCTKSAEQGFGPAEFTLADMYFAGMPLGQLAQLTCSFMLCLVTPSYG
jgi:TPR repeat protein